MATVLRTDIKTLLAAIRAQMVLRNVGSEDNIYAVNDDEDELPGGGGFFALLRPRGETVIRNVQDGSGRYDRRVLRRLSVLVYTNLNLDETGHAFAWFTDQALGHLQAQDAIIDALDTFQPDDIGDGSGNVLTYEPIRYLDTSDTKKEDQGWGKSTINFEIPYIRSLDQSRQ